MPDPRHPTLVLANGEPLDVRHVILTNVQVRMASAFGLTVEEYARELLKQR